MMHAMRSLGQALTVVLAAVAVSCGPAQSAPPPAVNVAPPTPAGTGQPDASAPPPSPSASAASTETLLFDFHQDGDAAAFVPPTTVLFRRATHGPPPCRTELRGGGNMWSAADVQAGFRLAEVSFALQNAVTYQADRGGARLTAPGYPGSITWVAKCADCKPEPPDIKHFRKMMQTVVDNRRQLCP